MRWNITTIMEVINQKGWKRKGKYYSLQFSYSKLRYCPICALKEINDSKESLIGPQKWKEKKERKEGKRKKKRKEDRKKEKKED